jgi:D-tyrosyl-tRNA(Tyr) deacylase
MRAVVQRVTRASVTIAGTVAGAIDAGPMVLVGVAVDDTEADAKAIAAKIAGLRIFADASGAMNLDLAAVDGAVLLVSQFTLLGDTRHGRRPSFTGAARGETANALYERVATELRGAGVRVETGVFGADMQVALVNDGPVTILLDTEPQARRDAKG